MVGDLQLVSWLLLAFWIKNRFSLAWLQSIHHFHSWQPNISTMLKGVCASTCLYAIRVLVMLLGKVYTKVHGQEFFGPKKSLFLNSKNSLLDSGIGQKRRNWFHKTKEVELVSQNQWSCLNPLRYLSNLCYLDAASFLHVLDSNLGVQTFEIQFSFLNY